MYTSIQTDLNLEKSRMKIEVDEEVHIKLPQAADNTNVSTQNVKSALGLRGSAAPSDNLNDS